MNPVLTTTSLTPARYEHAKTREERAADWAYTINHAISCGLTDVFIQPPIGAWVQTNAQNWSWFRWVQHIFEDHSLHGHDHGDETPHTHGPGCGHHHDDAAAHNDGAKGRWAKYWGNLKHWYKGEFIADTLAIPLTMLVQRAAPDFMHGLRRLMEPVAGGFFRSGAERDARHWGLKHNLTEDAPEVRAKADILYEHEISHLPQALVWNAFSIPINIGTMMYMNREDPEKGRLFLKLLTGKTFGTAVSNGLLIGGRAFSPRTFHGWDEFQSKYAILPFSKIVGKIFGVDEKTLEHAHHHRYEAPPSGTQTEAAAANDNLPGTRITQPIGAAQRLAAAPEALAAARD